MGLTYAALKLTNLFTNQQLPVNALVDRGATFMCVTEEIALQLGFDITEVRQQTVTLADGHQRKVPKIAPIEIVFENQLRHRGGGSRKRAATQRYSARGDGSCR